MSAANGKAAVEAFLDAFNRVDVPGIADAFNFPHIRLNKGRFITYPTREDFIQRSTDPKVGLAAGLHAEGWHHTTLESVEVIHATDEKVHMTIGFTRRRADDAVYSAFQTLWIATRQDGHWGIAFRSSYLGE